MREWNGIHFLDKELLIHIKDSGVEAGQVLDKYFQDTDNKWLHNNLKIDNIDKISVAEWLAFPQQHLLQFVAGEVFNDDLGELSHARDILLWYPEDMWLWIMACQWHFIGVKEPFIERTLEAGNILGSQLVINKMIRYIMEMWFLQNQTYWPYDKWFGTAFSHLSGSKKLEPLIWSVWKVKNGEKQLLSRCFRPAYPCG